MRTSITQNKYKSVLIIIFWTAMWEVISLVIDREIYLPSPMSAFNALTTILGHSESYIIILHSTYRTLAGFGLSCIFGITLGYLSGRNDLLRDILTPFVSIMRTVPVMSIIIIALIWFKSTNVPIFVAILMCFPIMWTNTVEGIKNTDIKLLEVCSIYSISKLRIITSVYLRSALPYIKAGMISSLGIGWKVTSAAEVMSLPKYSIGSCLYDSKVYLDIPSLFAWTIIIVILSYIFERLLAAAMSKL